MRRYAISPKNFMSFFFKTHTRRKFGKEVEMDLKNFGERNIKLDQAEFIDMDL